MPSTSSHSHHSLHYMDAPFPGNTIKDVTETTLDHVILGVMHYVYGFLALLYSSNSRVAGCCCKALMHESGSYIDRYQYSLAHPTAVLKWIRKGVWIESIFKEVTWLFFIYRGDDYDDTGFTTMTLTTIMTMITTT